MRRVSILVSVVVLLAAGVVRADNWPQFRGPNCSGISRETADLPVKFSDRQGVAWRCELGDGIGCPVVADGRVVVSTMFGESHVGLVALEAASGRKLWERRWPIGDVDDIHRTNSYASTTPAIDSDRVYFYFWTLGLVAVDAQTGADVWHQKLPIPYFVFRWGAGMSPVLYDDLVIFVQDDDLHPSIRAFDRKTGQQRWMDDRSDMAVNYSHPVICRTPAGDELVVAGTGLLIGYDPRTGKRLWQARTLLRNIKTTPVCHDGIVYVSVQSGGIANQWLVSVDQAETGNGDGRLTREEIQAFVGNRPVPERFYEKTFGRGDLDGDGDLEGRELDLAFLHPDNFAGASYDAKNPADQCILAVRGGGRGDVTDTHVLWKHRTKHTDHIVSPLVVSGRMLLVKEGGIATCFDVRDGSSIFGPVRIRNEGQYFASPVCGGGRIYVAGENGRIVVLENAPTLKVLAVNEMGDAILASPAISDGALYVRTRSALLKVTGDRG